MANYYTQFSVLFPLKSEDEKAWWKRHLAIVDLETALDTEGVHGDTLPEHPQCIEVQRFKEIIVNEGNDSLNFEWSFDGEDIWFRTEESGNVGEVACYVSWFLYYMRPDGDDEFVLTWAGTCDKLRADGFDGGTIVATKDGVGVCNASDQLDFAKKNIKSIRS